MTNSGLGFGELSHPEIEKLFARRHFFSAISKDASNVLEHLRDTILLIYCSIQAMDLVESPHSDYLRLSRVMISSEAVREQTVDVHTWAELVVVANDPDWLETLDANGIPICIPDFAELLRLRDEGRRIETAVYGASAIRKLRDAILDWQLTNNLNEDWLAEAVFTNLVAWAATGIPNPPEWRYPGGYMIGGPSGEPHGLSLWQVAEGSKLNVRIEPDLAAQLKPSAPAVVAWNPVTQSWRDYKTLASAAFEDVLERHRELVLEIFTSIGFRKLQRIRRRTGPTNIHYSWLVAFQVLGKSVREITDTAGGEHPISESAVRKAIAKVAKLIDIKLRSAF